VLVQLLDQKMAELAQEPEGWDDVVSGVAGVPFSVRSL
jgi:hypothetical protein